MICQHDSPCVYHATIASECRQRQIPSWAASQIDRDRQLGRAALPKYPETRECPNNCQYRQHQIQDPPQLDCAVAKGRDRLAGGRETWPVQVDRSVAGGC